MWGFLDYPYSLILPAAGVAFVLWWWRNVSALRPTVLRTAIIYLATLYVLFVGSAELYGMCLDHKVSTFDLNGDGLFSATEATPEYLKYSALLTNDTGRNLAPITGVAYSLVCAALFYIFLTTADRLKKARE